MHVVNTDLHGPMSATVIIAAERPEAFDGMAHENMAITAAQAAGLTKPGINKVDGPYPVDAQGKTSDELMLGKAGPVAGWQCAITLLSAP